MNNEFDIAAKTAQSVQINWYWLEEIIVGYVDIFRLIYRGILCLDEKKELAKNEYERSLAKYLGYDAFINTIEKLDLDDF